MLSSYGSHNFFLWSGAWKWYHENNQKWLLCPRLSGLGFFTGQGNFLYDSPAGPCHS